MTNSNTTPSPHQITATKSLATVTSASMKMQGRKPFPLTETDTRAFLIEARRIIEQTESGQQLQLKLASVYLLFSEQLEGKETTTYEVAEIFDTTIAYAPRIMDALVKIGLVERIRGPNTRLDNARGSLNTYFISQPLIAATLAHRNPRKTK